MNPKERAIQSFQENQNLIFAINTLSIHIKLKIAGYPDLNKAEVIPGARERLSAFLSELNSQVQCVEVENKPLLGVNPRRRQFVRHLIAAKHNSRISSPFLLNKLEESRQFFHSDVEADKQAILFFLEELRMLLEEHIASDTEILLGRI